MCFLPVWTHIHFFFYNDANKMYYKSHVTAISRAENGDLSSVGGRK